MNSDTLTSALRARGLPISGNKDQKMKRLLSGQPDKRKSKVNKADALLEEDDQFVTYAVNVRKELLSQGFADEMLIATEIKRRYAALQVMKMEPKVMPALHDTPTKPTQTATEPFMRTLPFKLSDQHAATANLVFVSEVDGFFLYMIKPKPTTTTTSPAASSSSKKRVRDDAAPESDIDNVTFHHAVDVVHSRLMKHAKEEKMIALLDDYGIVMDAEQKDEIARALAEQLLYETDDDEEEE